MEVAEVDMEVAAEAVVVVTQAALLKKVAQSMVVITIRQRIIRVKRDIILITVLTKVKREAAAKAKILIIIMKKAVMKVVVMMKLTNMDHIMKVVRDRRVENTDTRKDTKRVPKQLDIITNPARMTTTRSTNSTMMLIKKEVTISMVTITHITHRKEVKVRRADITNLDTKEIVSAKRVKPAKVIMMTIIKDIRDTMDTKVTLLIMTILERKVAHLVDPNMASVLPVDMEVAVEEVDTEVVVEEVDTEVEVRMC